MFIQQILFAVILFATSVFLSCDYNEADINSKSSEFTQSIDSLVLRQSVNLYKVNCAGCHGETFQEFVNREFYWGATEEKLIESIKFGREDDGMPAFAELLNDSEINGIVKTIHHFMKNGNDLSFIEDTFEDEIYNAGEFKFKLQLIAKGFDSPWGLAFLPNGELLVADKNGELWSVPNAGNKIEISGVPEVFYRGQGGLMDIEIHPNFNYNKFIYLSYSKSNESGKQTTFVSRYKLENNSLKEEKLIFEALPYESTTHHYGSRIEFDNTGYLYITIGDRGKRDTHPQSLGTYPGKVHRFYDDGRIPEDNPFYNTPNAVRSIFSYGHRNQQGMIRHPETGEIWTHEHGPQGGDELNIVKAGLNYGWPIISYGINYDGSRFTDLTELKGMEQPLIHWTPSIAPCGMDFVRGNQYPGWKGDLLVGSLKFRYIVLCEIENNSRVISQKILLEDIGRVRAIKQSPGGYIFVGVENPGKVYRLVPLK